MTSLAPDDDASHQGYIAALQRVIAELHDCSSEHLETVHVSQAFRGSTVWHGDVEVFRLRDHPRAQRCYAWIQPRSRTQNRARFFAVLGSTAIKTALDAVKFAYVAENAPLIEEFSKLGEHNEKPRA